MEQDKWQRKSVMQKFLIDLIDLFLPWLSLRAERRYSGSVAQRDGCGGATSGRKEARR